MRGGGNRGSKPLTYRDWLFGSRPRRLLLSYVLANRPGKDGWSKAALAGQAGVHPKGGVDEHVRGLLALDLLEDRDGRYWPPTSMPPVAEKLIPLLRELEAFPDQHLDTSPSDKKA